MFPIPRDRALVLHPDFEIIDKMRMIRALGESIQRQKIALAEHPSMYAAQQLQRLQRERRELMGTLPPLRLVP